MAEREGFEPSVEVSPYTRLAGEHLKPTRSSLRVAWAPAFRFPDYLDLGNLLGKVKWYLLKIQSLSLLNHPGAEPLWPEVLWRRERDSNPRSPEGKRFSRPPP